MTYDELYKKYQDLLKENEELRKENKLYQQQYGAILDMSDIAISDPNDNISTNKRDIHNDINKNTNSVNINSSPEDKIKLFMSLFSGRKDVYAHRWESKAGKLVIHLYAQMNGLMACVRSRK